MKIMILSSHTPSLFWFRKDMMLAFRDLGHEVVAIGNESEAVWGQRFLQQNIRYLNVNVQRNGLNPLQDIKTFFSLKRILKKEKPDKIFSYQAKTVIYGGIAARQLKIETYPLIAGIGSVFLSHGVKAKLIRTILEKEYCFGIGGARKVFFQNADDRNLFLQKKIVDANKVVMLNGSGVNLKNFSIQPFPDTFGFLCIGRLIKDKGILEYLQAASIIKRKHPNVRFLLVGPFDTNPSALQPEELQPYIDSGAVEYYGEQTDVRPYLAQCCVYVLPSYHEGTPKTVLEAMASGRAIITTDAPGCRETVQNGINGFLVPVRNVELLVQKMEELINNKILLTQMAQAGRYIVETKYDVNLVNQTIIDTMQLA